MSTNPAGGAGTWESKAVEDKHPLVSLACTGASLCIVGDEYDQIFRSTTPSAGSDSWTPEATAESAYALACPSASLCVGATRGNILVSTEVGNPSAGRWVSTPISGGYGNMEDVTCPTSSLCLAVDSGGLLLRSTEPTGGPSAWTVEDLGGGALVSISCPTATFCAAATRQGSVLTTHNPTGGAGAWTTTNVAPSTYEITTMACASASLCVAFMHSNTFGRVEVRTSTNPDGGSATWEGNEVSGNADNSSPNSMSCPSTSLCVAASDADILTTANPAGGAGTWTELQLFNKPGYSWSQGFEGVSCPTSSFCLAVSAQGYLVSSSNPTGGASAWTKSSRIVGYTEEHGSSSQNFREGFGSVSCLSASFCVALGGQGVVTSTNPTGGPSAWHTGSVPAYGAIACPSTSLCVAGGYQAIFTTTHPGSISWTGAAVKNVHSKPVELSCESQSFCAAVDEAGRILTSTSPREGGSWTATALTGTPYLGGISCPSTSLCLATDGESDIWSSTTPASSSPDWHSVTGLFGISGRMSCPTTTLCVGVGWGFGESGNVAVSTNPAGDAGAWMESEISGSTTFTGVSCPSATFCAVVDQHGNVFVSSNPSSGGWTKTGTLGIGGFSSVSPSISCASTALCAVADWESSGGKVYTSTEPTNTAATWNGATVAPGTGLTSIACPSTSFCAASGISGSVYSSESPTGGTAAWTATPVAPRNSDLTAISCPTATFCATLSSAGFIITASNTTQHSLTVAKGGSGVGSVSSSPVGIDCGVTCSHSFDDGTTVTLGAAADEGSTFAGWSGGGCSGTGTCEVTMTADQEVTATFAPSEAGGGGGGTSPIEGGNPSNPSPQQPSTTTPHKKPLKCRKGFKKKKVHGKVKCVKTKKVHRHG